MTQPCVLACVSTTRRPACVHRAENAPPEDFGYLSEGELAPLLRPYCALCRWRTDKLGLPRVQDLRDKALLALLSLQVLRTVEITRANVDDLQRRDDQWALLVRGKRHDRLMYLPQNVAEALEAYLGTRGQVSDDALGEPLMTAVGNRVGGKRSSRRGVRTIVHAHLARLDLKRPGVSNHALRHSDATLAYKYTHDLRAVQDLLGHADPRTTARYARRRQGPLKSDHRCSNQAVAARKRTRLES